MKLNWFLIVIITANLLFSTVGDVCAKLWGVTNNQMWFYVGAAINVFTLFTFMLVVKHGGISTATALVLLLTITINVLIGFLFFHENISSIQWFGIGIGVVAIIFILDIFKLSN